jgi:ferredoxin-fold anticodon binding domain-containing protein
MQKGISNLVGMTGFLMASSPIFQGKAHLKVLNEVTPEYRAARRKRNKRAHKQRLRNHHGKVVSR